MTSSFLFLKKKINRKIFFVEVHFKCSSCLDTNFFFSFNSLNETIKWLFVNNKNQCDKKNYFFNDNIFSNNPPKLGNKFPIIWKEIHSQNYFFINKY